MAASSGTHRSRRDGSYVVGALAALTLGPAAGNLGGARVAADILVNRGRSLVAQGSALTDEQAAIKQPGTILIPC